MSGLGGARTSGRRTHGSLEAGAADAGGASHAIENWQRAGFGLYVHWPFCAAKCPYCDFNSHVSKAIDADEWERGFLLELDRAAERAPGRVLGSVFFGGGTPSLMPPRIVEAILDRAARVWSLANDCEVTLEANPSSVEAGRLAAFRDAGVNRVSLGVQALRDDDLRALGRLHDVREAREAVGMAARLFPRFSFDLIYARQNQSPADWTAELREALCMAGDHMSLYQLTIEPGTVFERRRAQGGLRGLPDEDAAAEMYEITQDLCSAAGLQGYETSNHARAGSESRHNLVYWRGGDWIGIGPGAHERITDAGAARRGAASLPLPANWLSAVGERRPLSDCAIISPQEAAEEYLMMSLRLLEGTDLGVLRSWGFRPIESKVQSLADLDLIARSGGHLRATPSGRPLLDALLRNLTLEPVRQQFA